MSKSTVASMNPLAQLRLAREKPAAAALGATAGIIPFGVFWLGHHPGELTSLDPRECPKALLVYAGLLFSCWTVVAWSTDMLGNKLKALLFTALIEGIMMTSHTEWLTYIALGYLIFINASANGCRLAIRDLAATGPTEAASAKVRESDDATVEALANLARGLAAAAAAAATVSMARAVPTSPATATESKAKPPRRGTKTRKARAPRRAPASSSALN